MNCGSGLNSTIPLLIVYVPSPGTTTGSVVGFPVLGSINSRLLDSSIGTISVFPFTDTRPPKNCGNPF